MRDLGETRPRRRAHRSRATLRIVRAGAASPDAAPAHDERQEAAAQRGKIERDLALEDALEPVFVLLAFLLVVGVCFWATSP